MPPSTATYVRTPGIVLDRADAVERDARGRGDRTARLRSSSAGAESQPGVGERLRRRVAQRPRRTPRSTARRRRRRRSGTPSPPPRLSSSTVGTGVDARSRATRPTICSTAARERVEAEDLRADVAVQAGEARARRTWRHAHRGRSASPLARPKPNFESSAPVSMYSCVCASTPGVTRTMHRGRGTAVGDQRLEPVELVERSRRRSGRRPPRARRAARPSDLLLPWNTMRAGREPGVQRDVQLAAGRDVEVEPLLGDEPRHRGAEERLARVRDRRRHRSASAYSRQRAAQLVLVVDVQRRAEARRRGRRGRRPPTGRRPSASTGADAAAA